MGVNVTKVAVLLSDFSQLELIIKELPRIHQAAVDNSSVSETDGSFVNRATIPLRHMQRLFPRFRIYIAIFAAVCIIVLHLPDALLLRADAPGIYLVIIADCNLKQKVFSKLKPYECKIVWKNFQQSLAIYLQ